MIKCVQLCRYCGQANPPDTRICIKCGVILDKDPILYPLWLANFLGELEGTK